MLDGHELSPAVFGANASGPFRTPRPVGAGAQIPDFAGHDQVVEGLQALPEGRDVVIDVRVVQIDAVGLDAPQAVLHAPADRRCRCGCRGGLHAAAQKLLALVADKLASPGPPGVAIGRVEEIAAHLDESVEHRERCPLVHRGAHDRGPEANLADLLAGAGEFMLLHLGSFRGASGGIVAAAASASLCISSSRWR